MLEIEFDLKFKTNIELTSSVSSSQIVYEKGQEGFVHTFKLTNHGPSYTNQDKILKLYFPHSNLTSLVRTPNITDITCTKEISDEPVDMHNMDDLDIPSDENPFGCVKGKC